MALQCRKCNRVNPGDALFCYFDGNLLDNPRYAGMIASGRTLPFPRPLVLPSGRSCRTFDDLARACNDDWAEGMTLLRQGHLEAFLMGIGRADLAVAAREGANYPDPERGLDQFLSRLPSGALRPPQLRVQPPQINLGTLLVGGRRHFTVRLENAGMRLLYGSVSCANCPWLAVGDPPGTTEKLFHFRNELVLPIQVCGQRLRASQQPFEGQIVISSNGGNVTVGVRAEVPVKPFPQGVLAGAASPRALAKLAKARPQEAAALFQSGQVAFWYEVNGWSYPVQGPAASGLGAVQQFFEALGLVAPPPVEISTDSVYFVGHPGEQLTHILEVRTKERRPVYAHATSTSAWLKVGSIKLTGRVARIPLLVPSVPASPGETLLTQVAVVANGRQRFDVAVGLAVASGSEESGYAPVMEVVEVPQGEPVLEAIPVEMPRQIPPPVRLQRPGR